MGIESGDVETGRQMAMVDSSKLQNLNEDVESYSGFLTVDAPNNGNMFFWFFPAEESPETAPVVIWLQGGPGGSSMFGALKLHGPIITTVDEKNNLTGVTKNPNSWGRKHNMIYIDNPVGAGFSFSNKMPDMNDDVTNNLYEFLKQWYQLFPQYQGNSFLPSVSPTLASSCPPSPERSTRRTTPEMTSFRSTSVGWEWVMAGCLPITMPDMPTSFTRPE